MKSPIHPVVLFAKLIALALLLALSSCGKEPLVEPCGYTDAQVAKAGGEGQGGDAAGAHTGDEEEGEDGVGISDDGDDLGDSEGSRKKRPN